MGWRVLQVSVYLATGLVIALANAYWHWKLYGAVAMGLGIGLAWIATAVVSQILDHGLLAGLSGALKEALKVLTSIVSAVFVAMFIAPFQALKRWASRDQIAPRLPLPQQTQAASSRQTRNGAAASASGGGTPNSSWERELVMR